MKKIKLPHNKFTLVDYEDFEYLNQFNWFLCGGYVGRNQNMKRVLMARELMNPLKGMVVDHINHNILDNRKSNLRVVTYAENAMNRG